MIVQISFAIRYTLPIVSILLFLIVTFNYYYHQGLSIAHTQEKVTSEALETNIADNNIFENFAKQFGNIAKLFAYTVDLSGEQIFPNDTLKQDIVSHYKPSTYNI